LSTTSAPFGLRPVYHPSGLVRPRALVGGLASGYANNIFAYQPVKLLATGLISEVTANTDEFVGCFAGVDYTPTGGRPVKDNKWIGGTAASDITVYFYEDPLIEYEIQADGTVAFANTIGGGAGFTNLTAGNTTTGLAATTLSATITTGNQQFRVTDLAPYTNNAWGDAFVILRGFIGLHQYTGNKATI
jgi:hypothetical protein